MLTQWHLIEINYSIERMFEQAFILSSMENISRWKMIMVMMMTVMIFILYHMFEKQRLIIFYFNYVKKKNSEER